MPRGQHGKGYNTARPTPQHNRRLGWKVLDTDGPFLPKDKALNVGARCRLGPASKVSSPPAHGELTWHAAVTNAGAEFAVRAALQERGIDTVLPTIRYWRIRNRKRFIAERVLIARCVIFGIDPSTQSLVEFISRWVRDGDYLVPANEPARARSIPGIERIVRGVDQGWAVLPANEVYDMRFAMLRGEYDGTITDGGGVPDLPPFIRALVARGELPADSVLTHKALRTKGLKFSVAA